MTGHDQGNRVGGIGASHRAACGGVADAARQSTVADGFAERDFQQLRPDEFLEVCALWRKREIERLASAFEEFVELPRDFRVEIARALAGAEAEGGDGSGVIDRGPRGAEWRIKLHRWDLLASWPTHGKSRDFAMARIRPSFL